MTDEISAAEQADLARFEAEIAALAERDTGTTETLAGWLAGDEPVTIARAPGRLDVMGGIADYSGSLVLQMPLVQAALVAVQPNSCGQVRIASLAPQSGRDRIATLDCGQLIEATRSYDAARVYFAERKDSWCAYIAGALGALVIEGGVRLPRGLDIVVRSDVPEGKGVSSSAAIEVAAMQALAGALGLKLEPIRLGLWCQRVENRIVGAPCGVMDQLASACGRRGELLEIECQPADVRGSIPVPAEIAFFGVDSGLRHAVSGSDYGRVRVGAFMGHRILCSLRGLDARSTAPGIVSIDDPLWRGYLANLRPSELEARYAAALPETMRGAEFLSRYSGTIDEVTTLDPAVDYAVRQPTAHPVWENHRVRLFAELLPHAARERVRELLGELMFASHLSYSACGLGSDGTDLLVDLVRERGRGAGLYGAKISGGGSGGTVVVLGRAGADAAVDEVAREYARRTGRAAVVFRGSSEGATAFGTRTRRRSG